MRASVSSAREPMKPESRPSSEQGLESAVNLSGPLITSSPKHPWLSTPLAVTKEVVGIHVLPTGALFGDGILRRSFLRVSLAKPTSAPLRF
jgi:hypothetical protein